jgi:hypothetical protein
MNIKTLYFIFEKYLEKIHPNNAVEENEDLEETEDLEEIVTDLTNDYHYLCECGRSLILQINTKINEIKTNINHNNKHKP